MTFDWKKIVVSLAPMLGTALGGPLGGMAGAAIGKALGTPDADPATLAAAVQGATPEQLAALQKADQEFRIQMAKLGFENESALERIAAEDRQDARRREVSLRDWMPKVLAGLVVLGWLGVQFWLLRREVPVGTRDMVLRMLGTLDGALMLVLGYYFGSSAGSARKDSLLGGKA